ncbi:MAG: DUF1320 family protein [Proteobacteria bacterium]|nr:DUF1320 family protein [Pseudomonadota bacterium]
MYASQADMLDRFGEREVISLTDRSYSGVIDATVLNRAIVNASTEIDAYLASRYTIPLQPVPSLLVGITCDITRYRLCGAGVATTDEIRDRYQDAIKLLKEVNKGLLTLGGMPNGGGIAPVSSNTIQIVSAGTVFGRGQL